MCNLGQILHILFLHLQIEKSETAELLLANNEEGPPASSGLSSTTGLPCRKLRGLLGGLAPEQVANSVDCVELACNRVNIVKS